MPALTGLDCNDARPGGALYLPEYNDDNSRKRQALGRGDDLSIEGIPNGRQIRFKADFWRVSFGRRSTSG